MKLLIIIFIVKYVYVIWPFYIIALYDLYIDQNMYNCKNQINSYHFKKTCSILFYEKIDQNYSNMNMFFQNIIVRNETLQWSFYRN